VVLHAHTQVSPPCGRYLPGALLTLRSIDRLCRLPSVSKAGRFDGLKCTNKSCRHRRDRSVNLALMGRALSRIGFGVKQNAPTQTLLIGR